MYFFTCNVSFGATLRQGLRGTERRRIRRRDRQSDTNLEMVLNQLSAKGGGKEGARCCHRGINTASDGVFVPMHESGRVIYWIV